MGYLENYFNEPFWQIYRQLKKYFGFYFKLIPFDDISQEIIIAQLTSVDHLKESQKNIRRLIKQYGYNVTFKSKDAFNYEDLYFDYDREQYLDWVCKTYNEIREMYKTRSAKFILKHYGIPITSYALISISRHLGGKRKYAEKGKIPYDQDIAEFIFKNNKISRHAFRQWKYVGYIPSKYILNQPPQTL